MIAYAKHLNVNKTLQIEYNKLGIVGKRKRRRRSTSSVCPTLKKPSNTKIAGPYVQEETIRGAEKFSRYSVTIRVYNGAGDGPKSRVHYINTPEGSEQLKVLCL